MFSRTNNISLAWIVDGLNAVAAILYIAKELGFDIGKQIRKNWKAALFLGGFYGMLAPFLIVPVWGNLGEMAMGSITASEAALGWYTLTHPKFTDRIVKYLKDRKKIHEINGP